jgi:hypothetical protein
MRRLSNVLVLLAVLAVIVGPATGAHAAEIAKPSFEATRVQWDTQAQFDRLVLTVSTPGGKVFRQEIASGQTPEFDLSTVEGAVDGAYTWELRLVPRIDAEVRSALADARRQGDDAAIERLRAEGKVPAERVQSGSFIVKSGFIVASDAAEKSVKSTKEGMNNTTAADQVIADDLIVQGSACIGLDCVNNESFGFDTIRLKENNTRIKFEDTSTGTGFPTTDWQLTANDSASGGANKFSIEDITSATVPFTVTGAAPTNSIFVDSSGRLGLRTSTPVLDIHVSTSNTPALRLEQTSAGGFTAQTWDVAGNEANFFVRDVTGGSRLPFRIRPGAPTSSIDINASGNVGVGTASPSNRLDIRCDGAAAACGKIFNSNATGFSGWEFAEEGGTVVANFSVDNAANTFRLNATNSFPIVFLTNSTERIRFPAPGGNFITASNGASLSSGGTWTNASSRAFKRDIVDLDATEALAAVKQLDPVKFQYNSEPGEEYVGFVAEDVPGLVAMNDHKSLSSMDIVAVLTKVVQEQQKTIDNLSARLADLEQEKK